MSEQELDFLLFNHLQETEKPEGAAFVSMGTRQIRPISDNCFVCKGTILTSPSA